MKNFYEILEVNENASKEVIEKVYKVLAKKYHPDLQRTPDEKEKAEEKMKEINEAYSILSDIEKRRKYDMELSSRRSMQEDVNSNNVNASENTSYYTAPTQKYTDANGNNIQNNKWQEQSQVNKQMNDKLNKKMKKQQKKMEKKLIKKMQDEYLKLYGDYLRKNGYRVKYRVDYRKIPILIAFVAVFIIIGWILWILPVTHNYLVDFYNENIIIQKIFKIFFK